MFRRLRLSQFDLALFAAAAGLVLMSNLAMMSAAATLRWTLALKHGIFTLIGMILGLVVGRLNYQRWSEGVGLGYGASVMILAIVLVAGAVRLGATRWLSVFGFSLQPSELAKLTTAWLLARYLAGQATPLSWSVLGTSLLLVIPPALLVFVQPDLGSATIFFAIWFGMVWVAGLSRRTVGILLGALLAVLPIAWHGLKAYQRDRLLVFLDPHIDPLGAGYTIIQSTIAIGSGQLLGRGWFAGTQNQLSFLPERHSDFIFSVIGEEWGLLGCLMIVVLFGLLLLRIARVALSTSAPQGRLLAVGIFSWIGYQAFINMGMVMGVLPVVGVPLPLISYGGSSMVMLWVALGLVQSIRWTDRL